MARRFSWAGLMGRGAQEDDDDEDVEVVEFFSAAATSDATEKESLGKEAAPTKRKQRADEVQLRRQSEPPRPTQASTRGEATSGEYVVAGDVSLLTPPTKRRRMLSQSITAMETLIEVIADEEEVLSTRLEYCSSLWRFVREMHAQDVVEFVRQRGSSVVRVIEALLHTGYFPLQQLCFMTVSAILYQLHKKDTDALAAFVVACKQYLSEADVNLLDLLPLSEAIPWHDPRVARHRIVRINRRTGLCSSFRVSRCWVSPAGKQELTRIRVNKWIDIGSTTTTFYWRDGNEVVVVNVPHSCVEDVEIERENCILYIWTRHIERLKGVRLLAFSSIPEDFPGLVKALVGVEIEGYVEPSQAASPRNLIEFGSPIQTMKTASTLVLAGPSPPQSPTTTVDESVSFEPQPVEDNAFEPEDDSEVDSGVISDSGGNPELTLQESADAEHNEVAETDGLENAEFEPEDANSDVSDAVGAAESQPTEDIDSADSIESELDARLARAERRTSDSLESLHERLDANKEALTDTFSRVSSARLESNDAIGNRVYKLRARVDILQKKRLLDLSNAEGVAEDEIARATANANEHMEDTLDYAAENLIPDEPDFVFSTTSVVMLLVVVIPWVLFAALHSGTDFGSVRQLSNDAMVLLAALLRKFSG